ncbi:MAG: hypothetical protein O2807_07750 [bacterium]|nr:hypothetical protein [bacterium]
MQKFLRNKALLLGIVLIAVAAAWTLWPQAAASGETVTVYKSPT